MRMTFKRLYKITCVLDDVLGPSAMVDNKYTMIALIIILKITPYAPIVDRYKCTFHNINYPSGIWRQVTVRVYSVKPWKL